LNIYAKYVKKEASHKWPTVEVLPTATPSGAGGIRTPYLLRAKQMFSQLNYGPELTKIIAYFVALSIFLATHACCCYT
jgi:hypothetical protein